MSENIDIQSLPAFENQNRKNDNEPCPKKPGTLIRVFIPAGAVINLLNLIEVSSPSGICLVIRIPLLGGIDSNGRTWTLGDIKDLVTSVGGSVEVMSE